MGGYAPDTIEIVALGILYAAVVVLCTPFRRWASAAKAGAPVPRAKAILGVLSVPLGVLILTAALFCAGSSMTSTVGWISSHLDHVGAWVTFWCAVLALRLLETISRQIFLANGRPFPVPDLISSIIKTIILAVVAFWLLKTHLHKDISPLLASTALITAVVGFALQGVLGNLLSGMSLHVVRSVMPADWIAVDGVEGQVVAMNWRETRLCTTGGHIVIVPNSTLASSTVRNMSRPTPVRRHSLSVGASYSDAPADVIEALIASARSVPAVLADPPPSAFLTEYKDFGINYELRYWTQRYYDRTPIDGEVGRMIWYHFKRRGIEIPFPMSDKLLNDFMAVVYRQRRMPPEKEDIKGRLADLMKSDLVSKLVVDESGHPLLTEADLAGVAESLQPLAYTRGETIFRQGDSGGTCYIITRGQVRGRVEYESKPAHEFTLGPGAIFGEMSLIAGLPRAATIFTEQEVELLELTEAAFGRLLALRPEIPEVLSHVVAQRAAANAEAIDRLKKVQGVDFKGALRQESILKRFMHMIGFGAKRG